jgi:hypothetical protein
VPRNPSDRLELLVTKPPSWELLLFGAHLLAGLRRTETKWRDYSMGYSISIGPVIQSEDIPAAVSERMSRAGALVSKVEQIISPHAQELAFGAPGEPGDPSLIAHVADRLIYMYELMLDWADEFMSLRFDVTDGAPEDLSRRGALLMWDPINQVRTFVDEYVVLLESKLDELARGTSNTAGIEMRLELSFADGEVDSFIADVKQAVGRS